MMKKYYDGKDFFYSNGDVSISLQEYKDYKDSTNNAVRVTLYDEYEKTEQFIYLNYEQISELIACLISMQSMLHRNK